MTQLWGAPDLLARVLAGRGVAPDGIDAYLAPTLRALMPDPSTLRDMDAAVDRLVDAVLSGATVAIFGDYDVDGACSAALLSRGLERLGARTLIHIPDRIFEGYGPNVEAVRSLADKGASLLVTVDCGVMSHEPLGLARTLGLDCIVLDHHQAPAELPAAVLIVDPNRQDDVSGLGALCAAGVVFMTLVALHRRLRAAGFWSPDRPEPDLRDDLDLVALATVADVAPLVGLNRAFVARGLDVLRRRERMGLRALCDVARLDGPASAHHLGFLLGPRINAGGRIGDAALGARLLLAQDDAEAARIAAELDRLNGERQAIEAAALEEALAEAASALGEGEASPIIVTGREGWSPGIVGLVAGRLRERFRRPAFAIAWSGARGVGSGRSIPGVDLGRIVRGAVEAGLLVKGGGHAMAAGVTLERARLGDFRAFLEARLLAGTPGGARDDVLLVDAALTAGGATVALATQLEAAGPFGSGNPEPMLAFPAHRIIEAAEVGAGHVRVRMRAGDGATLDAIAFRAADRPLGRALRDHVGERLHLAGSLTLDRWSGRERVRLRLIDAAVPQTAV